MRTGPTYTAIDGIDKPYEYVYLSPHLDDAVLSCGGAIAAHRARGASVLVVTLCTAIPGSDRLGPLAEEFHGDWSLSADQAVTARLAEDNAAMDPIDADSLWAGLFDSIYRMPFSYDTRERLFGTPRADDPLYNQLAQVLPALRARCPAAVFVVPLGIGFHVDHQIVYETAPAALLPPYVFYEDVYYALLAGERERRFAHLGRSFTPQSIDIGATLATKIAAIDAYASQVPELFGGSEAMARAITGYAAALGTPATPYCERVWSLA